MISPVYQTLWRWHFYAGLLCMPFVVLLSVTGAIYLFKPQLEAWREAPYNQALTPSGNEQNNRPSANALIETALSAVPDAKFRSYRLPLSDNDAIRITLQTQQQRYYVYLHPVSGEVLHQVARDAVFVEWVKKLHGELLAGKKGSLLVELVASWAILMIISGLYLALSKPRKHHKGLRWWQLFFHHRGKNSHIFFKSLHTAIGLWVSILLMFLLISGLPWTTVWGGGLKEVRTWTTPADLPASSPAWQMKTVTIFNLTPQVLNTTKALNLPWPAELSVSNEERNEWKLASQTQNRPKRVSAWIMGNSGNIIRMDRFRNKSILDRAIGIGVAAHEGQLFGWLNQLLGLLTTLGTIALSITGFLMWWARKPKAGFAAPPANESWPWVLTLPMLLLPMALLSFILILVIDFVVKKRQRNSAFG